MPAPTRSIHHALIYAPITERGDRAVQLQIQALQRACRVALAKEETPVCPDLYYATFLSIGERFQSRASFVLKWLDRCDRIWLAAPDGVAASDIIDLDPLGYKVLESNQNARRRRSVFLLQPNAKDQTGWSALPLTSRDVTYLLDCNISAMLAACA
jgi:hypothetical protein